MPHQAAYGLDVTIRDDGATKTVLVHDKDGNERATIFIDTVPTGVRVEVCDSEASGGAIAGQVIAR